MPDLPGKHRDLSPMVSIIRDQVPEKPRHIRSEAFGATIRVQSSPDDRTARFAAGLQRFPGLCRCRRGSNQLLRNLLRFSSFQAHDPHIVNVRNYRPDGAPLPTSDLASQAAAGCRSDTH